MSSMCITNLFSSCCFGDMCLVLACLPTLGEGKTKKKDGSRGGREGKDRTGRPLIFQIRIQDRSSTSSLRRVCRCVTNQKMGMIQVILKGPPPGHLSPSPKPIVGTLPALPHVSCLCVCVCGDTCFFVGLRGEMVDLKRQDLKRSSVVRGL